MNFLKIQFIDSVSFTLQSVIECSATRGPGTTPPEDREQRHPKTGFPGEFVFFPFFP